jgi:hypothetical protein
MRTLINDTHVIVDLFNYEQHTDDKYCDTSPLTGELVKPFALANIKLVSNEHIEPTIDTLVCRVSIRLIWAVLLIVLLRKYWRICQTLYNTTIYKL